MAYFKTKDIAAIAICASLWGVLNALLSPVFFSLFHLPFLCDLIGFTVLALAAWWIRKPGAITLIGLTATAINFLIIPTGVHFLGFTAASAFFDAAAWLIGYQRSFTKPIYTVGGMMTLSVSSAALAGYLIGMFVMAAPAMAQWGGVLGWAGLHAVGGVIGGALGVSLILALNARKVTTHGQNNQ
jgi:uncharacterized membrane protein YvlD (DUF360 family)